MASQDLLLEIGVEELPASFVRGALDAMPRIADELLSAARLPHGAIRALGTPRRLSVEVRDVADAQEDLAEVVPGPPRAIALDADGNPTKAGAGFARKQGVDPSALQVIETDKGPYVAVRRQEVGRPAAEVLPTVLRGLCERVPFPKSMRWGPGEVAFGRPVHWLLALHGEAVVPFEFAGIESGRSTRGHRFLSPAAFDVASVAAYVDALASAHVVVDPDARRARMERDLHAAAGALGGVLAPDEFLVTECACLAEEPHVVPGGFDEEFLALPDAVVVSVMRDHQRYFAVRGPDGALLPRYLNVVNTANAPEVIARGNDRVLRARLADARFFVEEDAKATLASRVPRLDEVVFQKALGSVGDKVRRVEALAGIFAAHAGVDPEPATLAARLSKADLETLIVGEFPELQGEMGRWYARREGLPEDVADALRDHYLPQGAKDPVAPAPLGAVVGCADRMDTLVGCFGVGLSPTGSADPFALRRAALGVIRTALEGPIDAPLARWALDAYTLYPSGLLSSGKETLPRVAEFFRARLKALYAERHPTDLVEACLAAWDGGSVRDLDARVRAVAAFKEQPAYASLAIGFKRAFNIARDAASDVYSPDRFAEDAERALGESFAAARSRIEDAVTRRDYAEALRCLTELREPIDRFFDEVLVMSDDDALRDNRLALLSSIADTVKGIAHFNLLST